MLKGYHHGDLGDAWGRYIPTPEISVTGVTSVTEKQPGLDLDAENVTAVTAVTANSGIGAPAADAPPDDDDAAVPPDLADKRHLVVALGIEVDSPNIGWPGGGIPAGKRWYVQAARFFSDTDIDKAVAVLEELVAARKGN